MSAKFYFCVLVADLNNINRNLLVHLVQTLNEFYYTYFIWNSNELNRFIFSKFRLLLLLFLFLTSCSLTVGIYLFEFYTLEISKNITKAVYTAQTIIRAMMAHHSIPKIFALGLNISANDQRVFLSETSNSAVKSI